MRLGINLPGVEYYSDGRILGNAIQQGTGWELKPYRLAWADRLTPGPRPDPLPGIRPDGYPEGFGPLVTDHEGSPRFWCYESRPYQHNRHRYDTGTYRLSFDGRGHLDVWPGRGDSLPFSATGGEITVATHNQGIRVQIVASDPADPIRNIQLRPLAVSDSDTFHPVLIDRLKPFGIVRTMDWQKTNSSRWSGFDHRTLPEQQQTGAGGVCLEYLCAIANAARCHLWLCLPHTATVHDCRRIGEVIRQHLDSDLIVYLEHTNEPWNTGMFTQARWYLERGREAGQPFTRFYAMDAVRSMAAFIEGFGDRSRVIRIAAWQHMNAGQTTETLRFFEEFAPDDGGYDAIATAPYVGHRYHQEASAIPDADLESHFRDWFPSELDRVCDGRLPVVRHQAEQRLGRRIPLLAYEGGQHVVGTRFIPLQRSDAMREAYLAYLTRLEAIGYEDVCLFNLSGEWTRHGSWGLTESLADDPMGSAKWRGMIGWQEGDRLTLTPHPAVPDRFRPIDDPPPPVVEPEPEPEPEVIHESRVVKDGIPGWFRLTFEPDRQ